MGVRLVSMSPLLSQLRRVLGVTPMIFDARYALTHLSIDCEDFSTLGDFVSTLGDFVSATPGEKIFISAPSLFLRELYCEGEGGFSLNTSKPGLKWGVKFSSFVVICKKKHMCFTHFGKGLEPPK